MSRIKNLINILDSAEKTEFDKIVKVYLNEIYNYKRIVITDGKDDAGIDIKVFDLAGQSMQYQLTTQKSKTQQEKRQFEQKLKQDLEKAQGNYKNFSYSNTLFFFYSKSLTNKVVREYKHMALKDYGINLELIEAKQIAEESEHYLELQNVIYKISGLADFKVKESLFEDESKNIIYELISFGKPADLRLHIVESFILQLLFEKKRLDFQTIIDSCMEKFNAKENSVFYKKLLARLSTSKKITFDKTNQQYTLTLEENNRIENLFRQSDLDKKSFVSSILKILSKYQQEENLDNYIKHLKKIYSDNFNSDLIEVINNSSSKDLSSVSRDFINYISEVLDTKYASKDLAIELFNYCDNNKYIQKFCASKVFSEQTNLQKLETYANSQKKIFIDTSIALYSLCYYYNPHCKYDNYFFRTTYSLLEFCRKNQLPLNIPENYLWEVQHHVRDALNLQPFTLLPEFDSLGKSRNVFYNFYLFIREDFGDDEKLSFMDFLDKFGFRERDSYKVHNKAIEGHLKQVGINKYELDCQYDIEESKKIIQHQLLLDTKHKTKFGLNNDSIMLEFLADDNIDVHPLKPVFLTWDRTIFKVQPKYFEKFPTSQRWLLFTPSKLIDHYSLLSFSIDSETVSKEVIALLSDDIITNTYTLLDSLLFILNPNDEVGLEYTKRLANIRDKEIYKVRDNQMTPPEDIEGEAVIDDVFYKLTSHYRENGNDIDKFKKVFTKKEYVDEVIQLIQDAISRYYETKHFDADTIVKFDELINKMTSEQKDRLENLN